MTHKKYHRIRTICALIFLALVIFAVCIIIGIALTGGRLTIAGFLPVIIVAGIVFLIFAIVFGRVFCGFLCPLGLFFDIIWKISELFHLPKLRRNERFMRIIRIINRIFLVFFICGVFTLFGIMVFDPRILIDITIPIFVLIVIPVVMIVLNLPARRFFCNVCPIGSFVGIFKKTSIVKLEKDCGECSLCGACYEACPMRIKEIYMEVKENDISNSQCIYCGECIKKCQEDNALSITLCGRKIYTSSKKDFIENQFSGIAVKHKREKL